MTPSGRPSTDLRGISGEDTVVLDKKNRILINKKFRDRLGPQFVLALTEWESVCAYSMDAWNNRLSEIEGYAANNQGRSKYLRLLYQACDDEANCDPQGRLVIPAKLKAIGKLEDEVFLYGAGERLEFWNPKEYEKFTEDEAAYGIERRERMKAAYDEMTGKQ